MRTCSKCGSYVPDGKLLCVSCNRPVIGLSGNAKQTTLHERRQTHARIEEAFEKTELKGFFRRDNKNPYHGNTYEQHRSHDPGSKDYYKSKYRSSVAGAPAEGENILCLFAYIGFFFFIPLVMLPDSRFARFHANQGLVLFLFSIAVSFFVAVTGLSVLGILSPVLMGYGISNALQGKMNELPIIGKVQLIKDNENPFRSRR